MSAVDFALDLGVLMTEAKMIGWYAGFTSRGGQGFATSDKVCLDVAEEHEAWRSQAKDFWAENPRRTQTAVAKKIAPDHPKKHRNIIRVISDLDPRKQK